MMLVAYVCIPNCYIMHALFTLNNKTQAHILCVLFPAVYVLASASALSRLCLHAVYKSELLCLCHCILCRTM